MNRPNKEEYYLLIAKSVADRSTCLRRKYGAVIVKDDRIVSTGYNGAPVGRYNCCDLGTCVRINLNIPRGTRYELCRSVHAEQNAIINASPQDMKDSIMYLVGVESDGSLISDYAPCSICKRMILNSGISEVVTMSKHILPDPEWTFDNDESLIGKEGY